MARPSKLFDAVDDATQAVAADTVFKSTAYDVTNICAVRAEVCIGKRHTNALTNAVPVVLEGTSKASGAGGDGDWKTIAVLGEMPVTASESEALTATEPVDETVIALASTTNLAVKDQNLIAHTTIGQSAWGETVNVVTNTSVTLLQGLPYEQTAAASTLYNKALLLQADRDVSVGIRRVRVVAKSGDSGQEIVIKVKISALDSVK